MMREYHVPFCENLGLRRPGLLDNPLSTKDEKDILIRLDGDVIRRGLKLL